MKSKFFIAIIFTFASFHRLAFSASESPLTLDGAIKASLENNLFLHQSVVAQQEAHFAAHERKTQSRPKISQVDQYTKTDDFTTQLHDSNQIIIQGEQPLLQGSIWSDVKRLNQLEKSSVADLDQKRIEVILAVKQTYYKALSDSEIRDTWHDAESEFSDVLRFVAPKFSVGTVPEFDYAKIKLTISQYQQSTLDTNKDLSHQLFTLGELMATKAPQEIAALPSVPAAPELDLEKLLGDATSSRPDIRAAQFSLDAERFGLIGAKREYWPIAKVTGDYGYSGQTTHDLALGWGVNGLLTLPLLDFGGIHSRVQQAELRMQSQSLQLEALKLKIRTDINDQVQAVRTAWEKLSLIEKNIPDAQKAYQSSVRRYRTSLAPMTELSDAHDLWVQARIQRSQAVLEYRMALAELQAAQGLLETPR